MPGVDVAGQVAGEAGALGALFGIDGHGSPSLLVLKTG
jgi:hypothetical protein